MKSRRSRALLGFFAFSSAAMCSQALAPFLASCSSAEELLVTENEVGRPGGRLVVALRSEPKTLNPATAADGPSLEVIRQMTADLVHINRYSQRTEPALAKSWKISPDGRRYTLHLRRAPARHRQNRRPRFDPAKTRLAVGGRARHYEQAPGIRLGRRAAAP